MAPVTHPSDEGWFQFETVLEERACPGWGHRGGSLSIRPRHTNTGNGRESPIIAAVLAVIFLFVAWCHFEDRVIAPLLLSEERAQHLDAVLETVADSPDRASPTGKGGWEVTAGHHSLYFDRVGPVEFPRSMVSSFRSLIPGARYELGVQPWGTGHWRMVKRWLPTAVMQIINTETRSAERHQMLVSLGKDGEILVGAADTISEARQNVLPGIGLVLFFGAVGLVFVANLIAVLFDRR